MSILSRIKSTVISEINSNREYYLEAFTDAINRPYFATPARIMRASSVVGYLTLESERWLRPNSEEDSILEFDGVCFLDVCRGVRSMLGPGDLMSEIMPRPSPGGFIFPLILNFVGLDRVHISEGLPANYKNRLVDLITNLEKEDWGIDLAKVTRY